MSQPGPAQPPSGKKIALSTVTAAVVAAVLLATVILPAEYGLDPTGIGRILGLTGMSRPSRTLEISDVVGGNESVREVKIPEFGEPVPLLNPEVHQSQDQPPQTQTMNITLPADSETEVKMILHKGKAVVYSWHVDRGTVYSDLHGHDPSVGPQFWVRYQEHQEGSGGNGSLVAPFQGEHGWYWLNYNEFPVTVTLTISGYYETVSAGLIRATR
jgi:hypothetical protein